MDKMTSKATKTKAQRTARWEDIGGPAKKNSTVEHRSESKTTPQPPLEPESGPIREGTAQQSNAQTQGMPHTERPVPDQVGPEAGPGGQQSPEFVHAVPSFVHPEEIPAQYADAKPESRTAFEGKAQALMEMMRRTNMSINEIASLWKMSKAGVWNRVGHVQPDPAAPPIRGVSVSQPTIDGRMSGNGDETYTVERQPPRANSEIFADRPRIIEDHQSYNGNSNSEGDNGAAAQTISSRPADVDILRLLFSRQPEWLDIFLSIKAASVEAGYSDPIRFFNDRLRRDRDDADFFRAAIPHDDQDPESLRENFAMIVRKSNAFDEANKRSGLTTHRGGMNP
jgi:hypothetical protein